MRRSLATFHVANVSAQWSAESRNSRQEADILRQQAFLYRTDLRIHNSNRPIYAEGCDEDETGVFNPDDSVVSQPPVYFEYRPGMNAETTPVVLFEVLSKNTRAYDLGTKLPCYKRIPSLRYILYFEIDKPSITVYERQGPNRWTDTEYTQESDVFHIDGQPIALKDVYVNLYY